MAEKERTHHLHIELTQQQYQLLCRQARECGLTKRAFLVRLIEGNLVKARPSQEIRALRTADQLYRPEMEAGRREQLLRGWRKAVGRSLDWAEHD